MGEAAGMVYWFGVCYWIQFVSAKSTAPWARRGWCAVPAVLCRQGAAHGRLRVARGILCARWWAIPGGGRAVGGGRVDARRRWASPWLALGNAGIDMSVPLRLAPFIGVYGISFVFAMLNVAARAGPACGARAWNWPGWRALLRSYLLPRMPRRADAAAKRPSLVQPNVSDIEDWTAESGDALHNGLARARCEGARRGPAAGRDLIVWPEVPAPLYYRPGRSASATTVAHLARATHTRVLLAVVAHTPTARH